MGERRVVERPAPLVHPDRFPAHLDDERLRDRPQRLRRGDAERAPGEPVEVDRSAGKGQHRVQRERQQTPLGERPEYVDAVPPARMGDELTTAYVVPAGQRGDQAGERVVRHGEQHEIGPAGHLAGLDDRHPGQEFGGASAGGRRAGADRHHVVAGPVQGGAEHRTHPAGADHTDGEPAGALGGILVGIPGGMGHAFQSNRVPDVRSTLAGRAGRPYRVSMAGRSWRVAMADALYGPDGCYHHSAPADHFRTAVHGSAVFAEALTRMIRRVDRALNHPDPLDVVDLGAGRAELFAVLPRDPRWRLIAVDVVDPPAGLARDVEWRPELPDRVTGVIIANEWLDDLPLDVVEQTTSGPRVVVVGSDGRERLADRPCAADLAWLARWWPLTAPGQRAEVGRPRDLAWGDVVRRLTAGVALAVDYGHLRAARPAFGTLTGYRRGRQVRPVPDGSCTLTAHVALDACAAAGAAAGREVGRHSVATLLTTQRAALRSLGLTAAAPAYRLASHDPAAYLQALARVSAEATLIEPTGFGGFGWLVQAVGVPLPLADPVAPGAAHRPGVPA